MRHERLNPADQFTLMMDNEIRSSGLAGNYCALVLKLDGIPEITEIEQKCLQFNKRFPRASARIKVQGRQYYWNENENNIIPFHQHIDADRNSDTNSDIVTNILNQTRPINESAPFELHLVIQNEKSIFILRWFHPVCDAKGAELILYHLFHNEPVEQKESESAIDQITKKWNLWHKLKFGFKSKKNIDQLDKFSSILARTTSCKPEQVKTKVMVCNEQESQQIMQLARKYSGIAGTSLYFIGCMMRALNHTGNLESGEAYCVPYAVNLRKRKSLFPVFGNQVSFLFAQAPKDVLNDRSVLFSHLREQNKIAVKQQLDRAMLPLMQAGGWLNLEKYGKIVRYSPQGKERSSFWFSYTGSMDPEPENICDCPITQLYQFSQVTTPPALGLLVNHFQGRIILSFNHVDNQIDSIWLANLIENMKSELVDKN